MYFYEML